MRLVLPKAVKIDREKKDAVYQEIEML